MDRLADTSLSAASIGHSKPAARPSEALPSRVDVVVVGGGIVGTNIALHLVTEGNQGDRPDRVLLLERNVLTSGTTWHAAGLIANARGSIALTHFAQYGPGFYQRLQAQTGIDVSVTRSGSISLARTPARVDELSYAYDVAHHCSVNATMIDPQRVADLWPLMSTEGILAGLHFPDDGYVNPGFACLAVAAAAVQAGVDIREGVDVEGLVVTGRAVTGVQTSKGFVEADHVVLACGLWTRDIAASIGVHLPLYPAEHVHVRSGPLANIDGPLPVLRDIDNSYYVRTELDRLLVGAFEPRGIPRSTREIESRGFAKFEPNWEHFQPVRSQAELAVPALANTTYDRFINAPESFTPDTNFLMGETAEVENLYVAAGLNSQGIIYGPGIGKELATWIQQGHPSCDIAAVDVQRFSPHQGSEAYLASRTKESLGRLYAMHWPHFQSAEARGVRRTPLHDTLAQLGARFGEINALERANWFGGPTVEESYSFGKPGWLDAVAHEHLAARNAVALFDLSAFAKFEISGPEALNACLAAATVDSDVPVGRVLYSLFLNSGAGIEFDGSITRLAEDRFLIVTPSTSHKKAFSYLQRRATGLHAFVQDVTPALATIGVMGPLSRELMSRVSPADWSNHVHPLYRARQVEIGSGFGWVLRLSYAGELGYEIYVPSDLAIHTYQALLEEGRNLGVGPAGFFALDSLRLEKGYRHLGHDIGSNDDPYAAGLASTIRKKQPWNFHGHQALSRLNPSQPKHRTVHVLVNDPSVYLFHDETILANQVPVGRMTSGNFGFTLGSSVGIGVVEPETDLSADFTIRCRGVEHPATVTTRPFYDPMSERMK